MKPLLFALLLLAPAAWAQRADPVMSPTGPDAAAYGAAAGYPIGPRLAILPREYMVGSYSHWGEKYAHHDVAAGPSASVLRRAARELTLSYTYQQGTHDLPDYLARHPATGLLIARNDTILFEHYQYGRTDRDPMLSQSMAKTIVAMLVGIAVQEGAIRSIDQPASDYIPALAGKEFGRTPIRALLHMASGVAYNEIYDTPGTDNARFGDMLFGRDNIPPVQAIAAFNTREAPPDTKFSYGGIQTETLGLILTAATKMTLSDYLRTRIWQPTGAEANATWMVDRTGQEAAFCCVSAVLRDWARLGLMLAHDGAWNGRRIVPRQWMLDATTVQAPFLAPMTATRFYGYGYQIWLFPGTRRQFAFLGVHGQSIFVDPDLKLVLVHTAVRPKASGDPMTPALTAVWRALVQRSIDQP
jgi:CubicO group peptidase (beta-lactamase class C family)